MSQTKDEVRQNIARVSSQLVEFEGRLRRKEQSITGNIETERGIAERFASRRDFYEKMQSNMGPGEQQALANLNAAKSDTAVVQQRIADLESAKSELEESLRAQKELHVRPELARLGKLLEGVEEDLVTSSRAFAADEQRLRELSLLKESMDDEDQSLQQAIRQKKEALATLQAAPNDHVENAKMTQQAASEIQHEVDGTNRAKENCREEIRVQQMRKSENEQQKRLETSKTNHEQRALEERRKCVEGYAKELSGEKIRNYSLAAHRLEIELQSKNKQDEIRHDSKFLTVENRQLKIAQSLLFKKKQSHYVSKSVMPQMASKLKMLEQSLSIIEEDKLSCKKDLLDLKSKVDSNCRKLCDSQYLEQDALLRLEASAKSVAKRECEIEQGQSEERKATTIYSLMKERGRITLRKLQQVEQSNKDNDLAIQYQEIQKLDLAKKQKDSIKRAENFRSLYNMIQSEKVECTLLVGDTKRALNGILAKCADLRDELRSRTAESEKNVENLQEAINTRRAAQHTRMLKYSNKSKIWSSYLKFLEEVERQGAYIEKLKASLKNLKKNLQKEVARMEQLEGAKKKSYSELQSRKMQLFAIQNSSKKYVEAHKREEIGGIQSAEEERQIELKNKDIQRRIDILQRDLVNPTQIEERIASCTRKLELQIIEMEKLNHECETPGHRQFQLLEGEDPSKEELEAKLSILERLVKNKKKLLLETDIAMKEVATEISFYIQQKLTKRSNNKCMLLNERNEIQGYVQERKRLRIAQQSEIQMYNELIATGTTKMTEIGRDICLREQLAIGRVRSRKSTSEVESLPVSPRFERSTAYLPVDDGTNTVVMVPRPYGALAPFAPGQSCGTLRRKR